MFQSQNCGRSRHLNAVKMILHEERPLSAQARAHDPFAAQREVMAVAGSRVTARSCCPSSLSSTWDTEALIPLQGQELVWQLQELCFVGIQSKWMPSAFNK